MKRPWLSKPKRETSNMISVWWTCNGTGSVLYWRAFGKFNWVSQCNMCLKHNLIRDVSVEWMNNFRFDDMLYKLLHNSISIKHWLNRKGKENFCSLFCISKPLHPPAPNKQVNKLKVQSLVNCSFVQQTTVNITATDSSVSCFAAGVKHKLFHFP